MSAFVHPQIVARNSARTLMRFAITEDERLGKFSRTGIGFKALLSGEKIARAGRPDYGDPHPTPGAAKVPEIVKGAILSSRI